MKRLLLHFLCIMCIGIPVWRTGYTGTLGVLWGRGQDVSFSNPPPPILLGLADVASEPFWALVLRINKNKALKYLLWAHFSLGEISAAPHM